MAILLFLSQRATLMVGTATRFIRIKLFVWALISFGIFAGISYYRYSNPAPDKWWFETSRDLALGIFPLGLSILVWEFFLRKNRDQEIIENVEHALSSRLQKLAKLEADGIIDVEKSVSNVRLQEFMATAKRNITVFVPFFVEPTILEDMLREKLSRRNFVFQIVLFEPNSAFLRQRSKIVFGDETRGRHEVTKTMGILAKVIAAPDYRGRLEIRTFDSLPSIFIVRCDERALIGFYLNKGTALQHPHMIIAMGNDRGGSTTLGKMIESEFDNIFSNSFSRAVSPQQLQAYLASPEHRPAVAPTSEA